MMPLHETMKLKENVTITEEMEGIKEYKHT